MYLQSFIPILCYAIVSGNTIENNTDMFSSSVFLFFDEGNKLVLNNEITTLRFCCFGCIVAPKWTITASSCFYHYVQENFTLVLSPERYVVVPTNGATKYDNSKGLPVYELQKIILDNTTENNYYRVGIALLLQKREFQFTNKIGRAPLSYSTARTVYDCTSLTWEIQPTSIKHELILKPHIRSGEIRFTCSWFNTYRNEFCFNSKVDEETCENFKGSILVCNDKIQGIGNSRREGFIPMCTSIGNSSGKYFSSIYVDVAPYKMWIYAHIIAEALAHKQNRTNLKERSNNTYASKFIVFLLTFYCVVFN